MKKVSYLITILISFSCTEPYLLQTSNFEEALVIEATITNELKTQQIKLSKTYRLEENGPEFVENANVSIEDNLGNVYPFIENNDVYESQTPFQAIAGRNYKLTIIANGKTYTSSQEVLGTVNPIQNVEVNDINLAGERGAEIRVKAFDPTNSSKYYRYEFEETYKIIAPKWLPYTVKVDPNTLEFIFTPRAYEARTCYSTFKSNELILHTTSNLSEDRVDFMVRFIPVSNPIIMHRYSILVKQYIQNLASYTYYNTLKTMSGSGSILSQNQPGFFSGNIKCDSNPNEKIIGFFDVSSISSQRIFFNFEEVFPNTLQPAYFYDCFYCQELDPFLCPGAYDWTLVSDRIFATSSLNTIPTYLLYYSGPNPLNLIPPPCGDCTTFSSNVVPSFWQ